MTFDIRKFLTENRLDEGLHPEIRQYARAAEKNLNDFVSNFQDLISLFIEHRESKLEKKGLVLYNAHVKGNYKTILDFLRKLSR